MRLLFLIIAAAAQSCKEPSDDFVLLFVHVFKAAGSSMRALLRRYATKCERRWACLVQCSEGGLATRGYVPCRLRDTVNLSRESVFGRPPGAKKLRRNPNAELLGRNAQILGGHFHFGMHQILGERPFAYFTILREPAATWISGIRYHDKSLTKDQVVAALVAALPDSPKPQYANAITYMLDNEQRKQPPTRKLEAARANLRHVKLVGLVESWGTTIDMLQAVLDADRSISGFWQRYKTVEKNTANSRFSGDDVVRDLRRHHDTWTRVAQYLSVENAFYADALLAHLASCVSLLGPRCSYANAGALAHHFNATLLAPDLLAVDTLTPHITTILDGDPPSQNGAHLLAVSYARDRRRPGRRGAQEELY